MNTPKLDITAQKELKAQNISVYDTDRRIIQYLRDKYLQPNDSATIRFALRRLYQYELAANSNGNNQ